MSAVESNGMDTSSPSRNSKLLRLLFNGISLVYANGAKLQIVVTGEKL